MIDSDPGGGAPDSWELTPEAPRRAAGAPALPAGLGAAYEVEGELGRGAMGVVLRARERSTGRRVALKLVVGPRDAGDAARAARARERFRREGEITASLRHPGIVRVHAAGEADGVHFLAYELVEGCRTLEDVLVEGEADLARRVALVRDVARALGHAHARGVVHRDVKPSNVLVDAAGRVRVADFGLALAQGLERLTATGAAVGTPFYMAPEQVAGRRDAHGPATDVWALGVLLYLVVAGELPFQAETLTELTSRILSGSYDAPPDRGLGPVIARALRVAPEDRHPNGEAFAQDLDAWLAHGRAGGATLAWHRRRRLRPLAAAGLGLAVALGAGGAALALARRADAPPPLLPVVLEAPREGHETFEPALEVRGRAPGGAASVVVRAGGAVVRIGVREGGFSARLPLLPGTTELEVEPVDGATGRPGPIVRRTVRRLEAPPWLRALPPAARPPLPLPDGVRFAEAPERYVNERDGTHLVWVPPGAYLVGTDDMHAGQALAPGRRELAGFFMGVHEVNWGQWRRFCAATGRAPHRARIGPSAARPFAGAAAGDGFEPTDEHPVHGVLWAEAAAYCAWAGLRLPTELEWEAAARGPRGDEFPWGARAPGPDDPPRANVEGGADGFIYSAPVGSFPAGASPFGCLDMAGNVWEWTADDFAATGEPPGARRVMRGGGWDEGYYYARPSYRDGARTDQRSEMLGFRACRSP
ncbi:MAG: bifunctional serine/threonine-protein kinase/formylglycine-generating enzyme family protein [Planctomycetes bacterium]|nr:bifunctional serine/threonine-protein kinase/formylglycine-generating enzyme family protein [Planctomycetota bacterium]